MTCHKLLNVIFFLYADDSCLVCKDKDINETQKHLKEDFPNICDWLVDNKLSIYFGEDKTKSILFASNFKKKNIQNFNIKHGDIQIKQHFKVKYLGCLLDETMSGQAMTLNIANKTIIKSQCCQAKISSLQK